MDFLSISDHDVGSLEALAERSIELAAHWTNRSMPQTLAGARIGLIEELPGWRNPSALALGASTMGAHCVQVGARLEGAEPVDDLAGYMDNWFDLMGVRTPSLVRLKAFADTLNAPVINLRTNDNHPCEILGDLCYVRAERRSWDGLHVAAVGPAGNIAQSWVEAAAVLPIQVTHVCLPDHDFSPDVARPQVSVARDLESILEADLIVTDCWPQHVSEDEAKRLSHLQINAAFLDRCAAKTLFVPCPPVTRGQEVSGDAMVHPLCKATQAKAYLLHAQNAVMERALLR